jgi:hypothetical protein
MEAVSKAIKQFMGVFLNFDVSPADQQTAVQDLLSDDVWSAHKIAADAAAGDLYTLASCKAPCDLSVEDFMVCPAGALVAADATAVTLTLGKADGLGGVSTPIATIVTNLAGGNWVADVFKNGVVNPTPARLVTKGQILTIKKTIAGAGTIVPACTVQVRMRRI